MTFLPLAPQDTCVIPWQVQYNLGLIAVRVRLVTPRAEIAKSMSIINPKLLTSSGYLAVCVTAYFWYK